MSARDRLVHALAAQLVDAQPGRNKYAIQLGPDRVAEVTIEIRRVAGPARFELREEAEAYLRSFPYAADECGCGTTARGRFSSRSSRCTKRPSVAVEHSTAAEAAQASEFRFSFVCTAHAKNFLHRRTVKIGAELLKEARRAAERRREKVRAEENEKTIAEALTRACPFCHAPAGAMCTAPGFQGPRLVRAGEPARAVLGWVHAHRQGDA